MNRILEGSLLQASPKMFGRPPPSHRSPPPSPRRRVILGRPQHDPLQKKFDDSTGLYGFGFGAFGELGSFLRAPVHPEPYITPQYNPKPSTLNP